MLRTFVLGIALLLMLVGLCGLLAGYPMWGPALWGALLLACVLFERWRYHRPPPAGGNWQATGERFIDPESGRLTEVLYNPDTGERRYVPAASADK